MIALVEHGQPMRALAMKDFHTPAQVMEVPVPAPGADEVRVRVSAASVNGFDLAVTRGLMRGAVEHRFPAVLGLDFAGVIDALGARVSGWAIGDRVFGVAMKPYLGSGSFAEYVTVNAASGLAPVPDDVDLAEAAALGVAGTAAIGAVEAGALRAGQTVLIAGATGGVGNQAIQLAARLGATVIATAHDATGRALVSDLGTHEIVDYTGDLTAQLAARHPAGVDVVMHLAGDPSPLFDLVAPGGRFVSALGRIDAPEGVRVSGVHAASTRSMLERIMENHRRGDVRLHVQASVGLDDAAEALRTFAQGARGKVVIRIGER